jgi:MFS family permease
MPQLALFVSTTSILTTILEIPTGYVADKFSRKWSVALGFLCGGLGYLGYMFIEDIYSLLSLAVFFALGKALNSGAEEALIYDELKAQNQESTYLRVITRGALIGTISGAIGSFSGPILYAIHEHLPFIGSALANFCLTFFILTFKETEPTGEVSQQIQIIDGVRHIFQSKPILIIVCIETLLLVFAIIYYQILYFPKINELGLEIRYLGMLDVVNIGLSSLLLYFLPRLTFQRDKTNLGFYTLAAALLFVVFSNSNHLAPAILFGVLFDSVWTLRIHVVPAITNKYFESHSRALSLSSMSFLSNLGAAILVPLATLVFDVSYLFTIIPAILIAVSLYFFPRHHAK